LAPEAVSVTLLPLATVRLGVASMLTVGKAFRVAATATVWLVAPVEVSVTFPLLLPCVAAEVVRT
jgi:hypothetical protein